MALLEKLRMVEQTGPENGAEIGEEFLSEYTQDPVPNEHVSTSGKPGTAKAAPKAPRKAATRGTTALAKEVAKDMGSMIELAAVAWGMRDQCCAPVLAEQAQPIADAITNILARNPALLEKFANTDIAVYTMQTMALFTALAPVGRSVYSNHISKAGHGTQGSNGGIDLDQFPSHHPGNAEPNFTDFGRG